MKHAIPTDWDGQTFCRFAICWPDSPLWRALLRGLVTEPARGFFWDEKTGYIKGVLADFRQTMDYNLQLERVIMSCQDATELINALNANFAALNQTLQGLQLSVTVEPASPTITVEPASPTIDVTCAPDVNLTCSGGVFGPGGPSSPGYGPYGQGPINQPPANPGQSTPGPGPGGYQPPASWPGTVEEYDEYKCKAANFLVDGYINYVDGWTRNYENIGSVNDITSWMLALFGATPWIALLSPSALVVLASYLATIEVGLAVSEQFLDEYLDYLKSERENWVCDFYNAPSVDGARSVATNYVGGGGVVAWPQFIRDFHVDVMFKNYALNILFEEYPPAATYEGSVDCSGCEEPCAKYEELFTSDDGNLNGYVRSGEFGTVSDSITGSALQIGISGTPGGAYWTKALSNVNIAAGDYFHCRISHSDSITVRITLIFADLTEAVLFSYGTALGPITDVHIDLSAYAGKSVSEISFYYAKYGSVTINTHYVVIDCNSTYAES